jgi:hypothetical protein
MEISKLATKPQLVEIVLDDADILESCGEPITFWMKEHLDLKTYFDFYKFQKESSEDELMQIMRKIILKEDGQAALTDDDILPVNITLAALVKINETVGKSRTKLLKKETGTQV